MNQPYPILEDRSPGKISVFFSVAFNEDQKLCAIVQRPHPDPDRGQKCRQIKKEILEMLPDKYCEHITYVSSDDIILDIIDGVDYLDYR